MSARPTPRLVGGSIGERRLRRVEEPSPRCPSGISAPRLTTARHGLELGHRADQRGRYRIRKLPGGRSKVELRYQYGVAGSGIWGWISELVSAPTLGRHMRRTLHQLKRQVEHEQLRADAERRRRHREAAAT